MPEGDFFNPYNFVPAPERRATQTDLDDGRAVGHARWHPERWTGRIELTLKTVTPLLIPAANPVEDPQTHHKTFQLRTSATGSPLLPRTSVKGAIRSAFEAVTNSRMGVLDGHNQPPAYRMGTRDGLGLVPVRVQQGVGNTLDFVLMNGLGAASLKAAWLPRWKNPNVAPDRRSMDEGPFCDPGRVRLSGGSEPRHGDRVEAWVELWQKFRWNKETKREEVVFLYWRVRSMATPGTLPAAPAPTPPSNQGNHRVVPGTPLARVRGYVFISGKNIKNKHDERLFMEEHWQGAGRNAAWYMLTQTLAGGADSSVLRERWRALISNYQEIHRQEKKESRGPSADPLAFFSRHVWSPAEAELGPGTLAYAEVQNGRVVDLFPVNISRGLRRNAPRRAMEAAGICPPSSYSEFSPADRVFGWVRQGGQGAYKGHLRVARTECKEGMQAIQQVDKPLAILSTPKPQLARFYASNDLNGSPLEDMNADSAYRPAQGMQGAKGIRGRKVYPHQSRNVTAANWAIPGAAHGICPEWRRANDIRDSQNRSVSSWVKAGVHFIVSIEVDNLSSLELGALLHVLRKGTHLRMGGGKPLGFGSLAVDSVRADIADGRSVCSAYEELVATPSPANMETLEGLVRVFQETMKQKYPGVLESWEVVTNGYDPSLPVHYPRLSVHPDPLGENFQWFGINRSPLPSLRGGQGLYRTARRADDGQGNQMPPYHFVAADIARLDPLPPVVTLLATPPVAEIAERNLPTAELTVGDRLIAKFAGQSDKKGQPLVLIGDDPRTWKLLGWSGEATAEHEIEVVVEVPKGLARSVRLVSQPTPDPKRTAP